MLKINASNKKIQFIVALSFFMEAMDSTVINTAIPAMSHSLNVDPMDLKITLISYLLSLAIFIPISGWLADRFGAKRIFMTALAIFTISSLWCGFATNLGALAVARFIQGLGGALGLPVGRLILIRTFGREHMITTMNNVVMVGSLGMMLGPIIGGVITHYFSWHWIFWINIPIGILAILLTKHHLQESKPAAVHPLDKLGFILFGMSLAGFTFGLSALSETTVKPYLACSILLFSIGLLIIYAIHSHHQLHPIVKIDLLRLRTFRVSVTGNLISRLGFGGMPFLIPLFLQINLGIPAQWSGLLLAPIALGVLLAKPVTIHVLRAGGYKNCLIINTVCAGLALWLFIGINGHTPLYVIAMLTFLYGLILTLQYGAMNSLAYADLSSQDLSAANSIMSTLQQLAQSFGVAVSALLVHFFSFIFSNGLTLTTRVFHYTFFAMGCFTILSAFIFLQLKQNDGQEMIVKA